MVILHQSSDASLVYAGYAYDPLPPGGVLSGPMQSTIL